MKSKTAAAARAKRPYRQGARAEAAARTGEAILDAFIAFLETEWYEDISLDRLARAANVTVPTILRHFESKEGVLEAAGRRFVTDVLERRRIEPGNIDASIAGVIADYECAGAIMLRFLAQEERIPAIRAVADLGRRDHRAWVRGSFAPWLDGLDPAEEAWRLDGLVVALDFHVWKLLRRDRGRSPDEVKRFMRQLVEAVIGS